MQPRARGPYNGLPFLALGARAMQHVRVWAVAICTILSVPNTSPAAQGGTANEPPGAHGARIKSKRHWHSVAPRAPIDVRVLATEPKAAAVALSQRLVTGHKLSEAKAALGTLSTPGAQLVRARIALAEGAYKEAEALLDSIHDDALIFLVQLYRGLVALSAQAPGRAQGPLAAVVAQGGALGQRAAVPWAESLLATDPAHLIGQMPKLLALVSGGGMDAQACSNSRHMLLTLAARAHEALHNTPGAQAMGLQAFLQEPNAADGAKQAPPGVPLSAAQWIGRIEQMVAAHNSTAALNELKTFDSLHGSEDLSLHVRCRRWFALGLAARKLHRYGEAERNLALVRVSCGQDEDLVRRAAFTEAKVVNIQDGMRAVPLIEQFVGSYPNHTMTDDVLFWAGDSHQRRGHIEEAESYYGRILKLPNPDDQCEEAAWRMAWLAYTAGKAQLAHRRLHMALAGRCNQSADGKARVHYWLGRIEEAAGQRATARRSYRRSMAARPLGYYGQASVARLLPLLPVAERRSFRKDALPALRGGPEGLCPAQLVNHQSFVRGLHYLKLGLLEDAATALGEVPAPTLRHGAQGAPPLTRCGPAQAALLLSELRFAAGDHPGGLEQLLSSLGAVLAAGDQAGAGKVWRAAYPLAFRPMLAAAEREQELPPYLLSALAREESRFDPAVTSWAEAYGLTQLTLAAAQTAGRKLQPKVTEVTAVALFDPGLNARLGGALLGQLGRRYKGFWPLALAAYNGGQRTSDAWWQRFAGSDFARMSEELSVRETRTYVQRVMETYGIYRWLYGGGIPGDALPARVPTAEP